MSGRVRCVRFRTLPGRTVCFERAPKQTYGVNLGGDELSAAYLLNRPPVIDVSKINDTLSLKQF